MDSLNKKASNPSSTSASPSERRQGSDKNPKGSASSSDEKITFDEATTQALKNKVKDHNSKGNVKRKVSLGELKAVYRRGAGAFSTSHRPNTTRGEWAMARVNSYLRGGHNQDNDLKKADQYYLEKEEGYQNDLEYLIKSFEDTIYIEKVKYSDIERDSNGNLVYRGEKFAGFNKPRPSSKDGKDGMVLAKKGDEVKLIHFGDSSMRQNYSNEANDRFYDRFGGRPQINDVFSAMYWSARWLWPKGELKGKGTKPYVPLKKNANKIVDLMKEILPYLVEKSTDIHEEDEFEHYEIECQDPMTKSYEEFKESVVVKKYDEELMIAYDPLYVNTGESDTHGDGMLDKDIDELISMVNKGIHDNTLVAMIHHKYPTKQIRYIKASRMPFEIEIERPDGERVTIQEGQPIIKTQYLTKTMWEAKKEGIIKNPSIGGDGVRVDNPNYIGEEDE